MTKYIKDKLKSPNLFLFFAIVSSAILLMLVGTHTYNVMEDVLENSAHSQIMRARVSNIRFWDEVLTNSTLLAANTGDSKWEKRYRLYEPKLENAISEILKPESSHAFQTSKMTDNANVHLMAMEHRVFELIHLDRRNEAYEIITGNEYARQKAIYSEGLSSFIQLHELETDQLQIQLQNTANRSKWFFGLVILLLVSVWLPIERYLRNSRAQLLLQNQELELQIQARHESESALFESKKQIEKSKEQLQESIKASRIGLWEWNIQTNETYHSPEFKKQIGYEDDEVESSPGFIFSHLHPEDAIIVNELTPQLLDGSIDPLELEYRFRHKNGSYLWMLARTTLQRDQYGKPWRLFGSHIDISERKRAEEALQESEEKFRLIIENIGEAILFTEPNGAINFANPEACRVFGYSNEEFQIAGRNRVVNLNDPRLPLALEERNRTGKFKGELSLIRKDGSIFPAEIMTNIFIDSKGKEKTSIIINDITERKLAEEEIKLKNEELQKLNTEKDKFFSIIAHDLRGPLGGIKGLTEMIADESDQFTSDQKKNMTITLSHSAKNVFNLLENLLEWSQMQKGNIEFYPQSHVLKEVVNHCMKTIAELARKKHIEIVVNISNEQRVFVDTNMLQTIIRNLASNAIKFTPKGGTVTISGKVGEESTSIISVKDTGIGMSKEMLDNLFRLDVNTGRKGTDGEPSTGIGLLLCKEFVEKHGGTLWVESLEGKGSVFYFTLPYIKVAKENNVVEEVVSTDSAADQIKKLKILIAEDDETSDMLFTIALSNISRDLLHAKTGVEAVDICRNNPDIDLLLMDIEMPEMDGYEATRQVRLLNKDIVIFAQTAFAFMGEKEKAIEVGCNDYISKPIDSALLMGLIQKHFNKQGN